MMENYNQNIQTSTVDSGLRTFMLGIYQYMAIGLAITGLVAYVIAQSTSMLNLIYGTPLRWVVMFAPLIYIFVFAAKINNMSQKAAIINFYAFSALMGASLSYIFMVYTSTSIVRVFLITTIMFGGMSLFGYTTKKDLTGLGSIMMMGFWGIFVASIVNLFMQSTMMHYIISYVGVVVFTGLIAFDTQNLKRVYYASGGSGKAAIFGALNLYIDFINLFVMLLRIMGSQRD